MSDAPIFSIIIPTRNEGMRVRSTILSVLENSQTNVSFEVVVADDDSSDGSCDALEFLIPEVPIRIVRTGMHSGVARARNLGASISRGSFLFITDSHVNFSRGWDTRALEHLSENRILAATITDQNSKFHGYGCSLVVPFMGTRWNQLPPIGPVQIASSAGTIISKKLFNKIGGYDEGMHFYGAIEPEFSIRAWLSGAEIFTIHDIEISHRFKTSHERNNHIAGVRKYMIHNAIRFGLLYLSERASMQMIRHYIMQFPHECAEAFRLVESSDVWQRKNFLELSLKHDFFWFIKTFDLKNQIGEEIPL
jgi:glycosyltransferase involved in cell wall biosynthesis